MAANEEAVLNSKEVDAPLMVEPAERHAVTWNTPDSPVLSLLFDDEANEKTYSTVDMLWFYQKITSTGQPLTEKQEWRLVSTIKAGAHVQAYVQSEAFLSLHSSKKNGVYMKIEAARHASVKLAEANLGLILPIAERHARDGRTLVSLIQAGCFVLIEGAQTFDPSGDVTFRDHIKTLLETELQTLATSNEPPERNLTLVKPSEALQA